MSVPAASRQPSNFREIPTKRVTVNDPSQLPNDYSTTPGGTLFSTTPGGTRIIYDRRTLMHMRNSPLSQTPPSKLPSIPGVTCAAEEEEKPQPQAQKPKAAPKSSDIPENVEDQFQMEI